MKEQTQSAIKLLEALTERAKELTCLYAIEESLREAEADIDRVCNCIIEAIPPGWQYPDICVAKITLSGKEYCSQNFEETAWKLTADIVQQDHVAGTIDIYYTREMPAADAGPFLKEEKKLVETIADRLDHFLTYQKMKNVLTEWQAADADSSMSSKGDWEAVMDLIRQTDHALFLRITNKMLNHLCWSGVEEAEELRRSDTNQTMSGGNMYGEEVTKHRLNRLLDFSTEFTEKIFRIAANHLSDAEILSRIQMWIQEDKLGGLLRTVRRKMPLSEVAGDLRRYFFATREKTDYRYPLARGLKTLLVECILSSRSKYISLAKDHVDIEDLYHLIRKVIYSKESHGKLGGKSAGFFLASNILKTEGHLDSTSDLRVPNTWYITSDMMLEFIHYNNMDEVVEQKYKEIERIRVEYPHVIDMFRQTVFPPEMINGLSMVLDDLGDSPIIVRSSSLLEDRTNSAFTGKYKSVILPNQGSRNQRLHNLMSAIAEIYASNFGPKPIEYRSERGLIEFSEQLGVMIQQVVGKQVGKYFFPAYSGVACSRNDFAGLLDIEENAGIVRIIPGLGKQDWRHHGGVSPVLLLPGRPSSKINGSLEYCIRNAPKAIKVINLESNKLENLALNDLVSKLGNEYPAEKLILSVVADGRFQQLPEEKVNLEKADIFATFEGLITGSSFPSQVQNLLKTLEKKIGLPIEIEFACDGEHLYLLQCRTRTKSHIMRPAPIPKDVSKHNLIFSADRYVSNGWIPNITHIIYIKPSAFEAIEEEAHRQAVGGIVAKLNELLPKRQFVIIRPAASGNNDDGSNSIELNCSDIKNAAVLVDLLKPGAEKEDKLHVGIHFIQDIVEADIRYVPIVQREDKKGWNERFLLGSNNILADLLPKYDFLADVVRVIDVASVTEGKNLQVLMNSELGQAVGVLSHPEEEIGSPEEKETYEDEQPESYWRWRHRMAEQIALQLDMEQYGVENIYIFGSAKNGTAGPASDIDLLIHFKGTNSQREGLIKWLEGWSLCLDEVNYLRTGYRSGGLLDVHIITDEDIAKKTSYAVKINAITDAARPLKMMKDKDHSVL
jgi:predicted nucleotidyltransferase